MPFRPPSHDNSTDTGTMLLEETAHDVLRDDEVEWLLTEFLQESSPAHSTQPQTQPSTEIDYLSGMISPGLLTASDRMMTCARHEQDCYTAHTSALLAESMAMNGHIPLATTCLQNPNARSTTTYGDHQQDEYFTGAPSGFLSRFSRRIPSVSSGDHGSDRWQSLYGVNKNQSQAGYKGCEGQMELPHLADIPSVVASSSREVSSLSSSRRNSTQKGTASPSIVSTVSQPATRKIRRNRANTCARSRLFAHSLIRGLRSNDLFVFKSAHHEVDGRYVMLLVVGNDKVVARDRIADLAVVPSASKSDTSCLRETLEKIIVKAEEVHQTPHGLGETSTGAVIDNPNYSSYEASMVAKHQFLKAIAFFLTKDAGLDGSGPSIWIPRKADSTSQCWNIRITKLRQKAKEIFVDIDFPPRSPGG